MEAPPFDLQELLQFAGFDSGAVQVKEHEETASGQGHNDNDKTASGQESIDDGSGTEAESEDEQQRLNIFGGAGKVVAKVAKTTSGQNGKAAIMSQGSTPKSKGKDDARSSGQPSIGRNKKSQGTAEETQVVRLDGRSEKIQKAAHGQVEKSQKFFQALKFDEEFQGVVMIGDVEKSFIASVTKKAQALILEKNACRSAELKIERSPLKSVFSSESQELEHWIEKFGVVQQFLDFMRKPPQDLQASLQSFDAVLEMGFIVSKPYLLRALDASVQYKMLFSDIAGICNLLKPSSDLSRRLFAVCSAEEMSEVIAGKVESIILTLLQTHVKKHCQSQQARVRPGAYFVCPLDRVLEVRGRGVFRNSESSRRY